MEGMPFLLSAGQGAERPGIPRAGGNLSVSVHFVPAHAGRLRPGFAGPSCQRKGFQEQGSVEMSHCFIPPLFQTLPFINAPFCLRLQRNNLF